MPLEKTARNARVTSCCLKMQGVRGIIAPGDVTPGATIAIAGDLSLGAEGGLEFDLGGTGAGQYDRITIGGSFAAGSFDEDGRGRLRLVPAAGYTPALGDAVPVVGYATFQPNGSFTGYDLDLYLQVRNPSGLWVTLTQSASASAHEHISMPMPSPSIETPRAE